MMATFCHHDGPPAPHDGNASPFRGGAAPQWRQRLVIMAARARRAAHHGGSVLPSRAGRGPLRRPAGRQPFGQPDGLRRINWAARVGPPSRASHAAGWGGGGGARAIPWPRRRGELGAMRGRQGPAGLGKLACAAGPSTVVDLHGIMMPTSGPRVAIMAAALCHAIVMATLCHHGSASEPRRLRGAAMMAMLCHHGGLAAPHDGKALPSWRHHDGGAWQVRWRALPW